MVERVLPIDGAEEVTFDWEAAEAAIEILRDGIRNEFASQHEAREGAGNAASDQWTGYFQDEFRRAEGTILTYVGPVMQTELGVGRIFQITQAMEQVNAQQRIYNQARRDELSPQDDDG